jgi:hypothetical protein
VNAEAGFWDKSRDGGNIPDGGPMKPTAFVGIAAIVVLALPGDAQRCQPPREMRPATENLKFIEGAPGAAPPGWLLGPYWWNPQIIPAHEAQIVSGQSCNGGRQCATVHSVSSNAGLCFLYQIIDAIQYRGKNLTYRADVRADIAQGSMARLLVRVHRSDCSTSFFDNLGDHPITGSAWSPYQIRAPIGQDARDIEFGMQLMGQGAAWIDNISMTFVDAAK